MNAPVRALLDFGTNSLKLVVCRLNPEGLDVLLDTERITRLGHNILQDGKLSGDDVDRILTAVGELIGEAKAFSPDSIDAIGTAALRRCSNRDTLTEPLMEQYGIRLLMLSGSEEAVAGYLGVRSEFGLEDSLATLDLGGGSTEITFGRDILPGQSFSLPIGARGLLRDVPISDPPRYEEIEAIRKQVRPKLSDVSLLPIETKLVLIGGAATTLAGYAKEMWNAPGEIVADTLTPEALDLLTMKLAKLTREQRRALPGSTKADRSDVIVHGTVALREMLGTLGVDTAWVSLRSLPQGLFFAEMEGLMLDSDAPVTRLPGTHFPPLSKSTRKGEVVFLLRLPDGRYFLQTKVRYSNDTYRIPGGGVDAGERSIDAIHREVWEETGYKQARPLPVARLTFTGPDGTPCDWYSDLYLVDLPKGFEPQPVDESEGISGWVAVHPSEMQPWIDRLENLEGDLNSWGYFRAVPMRYLVRRVSEGRL
ncbi:NUDIX domain-containing protein [bacterium]|nr:NUDIX domain-containing protein [bacterium]